jgi:hypothetical protein
MEIKTLDVASLTNLKNTLAAIAVIFSVTMGTVTALILKKESLSSTEYLTSLFWILRSGGAICLLSYLYGGLQLAYKYIGSSQRQLDNLQPNLPSIQSTGTP